MGEAPTTSTGRTVALVVASLSSFITPFLSSAVNVALPSIGREFALDAVTLGWVASSYLLAAAVFLVPFGRIGDIYGRKRVFVYGAIVNAVSSLVLALSPSAAVLISFRTLQGIGGAMGAGTSLAILTSIFPARDRGKVLGINVAFTYFGLSLGPTFGGLLTQHFGWRSIFFATVLLGIAIIVAVLWKLRGEWAEARGEDFDLVGSVVYGLALVAFMYGFTILSEARGVWVFVAGVIGMLAFVKWETMTKSPVLSISLFKDNIAFSFSNLSALINYSATFAVGFLLSLYLQYIKGFSPAHAGVVLVAQPVVMAALSPLAGRLSDKLQPRLIASLGMATTTLGLAMLVFLGPDTGLGFILASLGILGLGFAFFSSPNTNAVMSSVENRFYGVAAGTLGTMRATGQTLSLGVVMLLFAVLVGKVQITPEYYPLFLKSTRIAFITFAVLCLGGIFASLARGKTR